MYSVNYDMFGISRWLGDRPRIVNMWHVSLLYLEAEMGNNDFSQFPLCRNTLSQHIRRVNYQTGIWQLAHIPQPYIHLAINGHGWTQNNEKLVPVWCQGPIIPIDIAKEDNTLESDDDVASSSEGEVLSDDSAVAESDSDED